MNFGASKLKPQKDRISALALTDYSDFSSHLAPAVFRRAMDLVLHERYVKQDILQAG